ncbi:MAG: GGDEF domain-containing protein, partial [Ruminococcus sp.]|nr:GGDEF domain-containing protein [Ruminococcus sp.]
MKDIKELALIVAGIDEEYQNSVIEGIIACAEERNANVSCFAAFGGVIANSKYDVGEYNIYNLINYEKFDGVILMTNTITDVAQRSRIISRVRATGLPAVVLDCSDFPEFYNVTIDNKGAMSKIVRHVIEEHGARTLNYISGPLENPEGVARYEAFLEVMAENNLVVDTRRVYFGTFRPSDGRKAIDYFFKWGLEKPDAIICANDAMALAAMAELERCGIKVPEDLIVTGFDNIYNASHHSPALTTVDRPLNDLGYQSCDKVLRLIDGTEEVRSQVLTAEAVFTESCGCKLHGTEDIKTYKKENYRMINSCKTDISLLNRMTTELAETENSEDAMESLVRLMQEIDTEKFCLCLCENWDRGFNSIDMEDNEENTVGYTENMTAMLIMDRGEVKRAESFRSEDMFPIRPEGGGNISFFLPLHYREHCLGYYVFVNSMFPVKSQLCHSMILNISNSIENIRKLIHINSAIQELDKLYVMDPLCNIYNRNGFIRASDPIFRKCRTSKENILISFIDMDGLKVINDNYGHEEGDFALQRLAGII